MSKETPIYIDNNHLLKVNVSSAASPSEKISGGHCELTVKDKATGLPVEGFIWPAILSEDADIPGLYKIVIPHNLELSNSQRVFAEIHFTSVDDKHSCWTLDMKAQYRKLSTMTASTI